MDNKNNAYDETRLAEMMKIIAHYESLCESRLAVIMKILSLHGYSEKAVEVLYIGPDVTHCDEVNVAFLLNGNLRTGATWVKNGQIFFEY